MKTIMEKLRSTTNKMNNVVLLLIRLVLAYGFYTPAKMKIKDVSAIAGWFDSMGYPAPHLSAYLATISEVLGVVLLTLGLVTRLISIPLIIVMLVAIFTVHIGNGFEAGNNGFEIPLYYFMLLLVLLVNGSGKFSIDYFIRKRNE